MKRAYERLQQRPGWMTEEDMSIRVGNLLGKRPTRAARAFLSRVPIEEGIAVSEYRRGKPWTHYSPQVFRQFCEYLVSIDRLPYVHFDKLFPNKQKDD